MLPQLPLGCKCIQLHVQMIHQDAVTKLEAQIVAAHEATAGKELEIQALESTIAELRNKQTELRDQAHSLEVTAGMFPQACSAWLGCTVSQRRSASS